MFNQTNIAAAIRGLIEINYSGIGFMVEAHLYLLPEPVTPLILALPRRQLTTRSD
jgi:hypothetical protein